MHPDAAHTIGAGTRSRPPARGGGGCPPPPTVYARATASGARGTMARPVPDGGLEIDQDLAFERRDWTAERAGWVVMGVLAAAALAGLLGPGPLARRSAEASGGALRVEYERFARAQAPTDVTVHVRSAGGEALRVSVDRAYLDAVVVERVQPEPVRTEGAPDRVTFVFPVRDPRAPASVRLRVEPQRFGRHAARIGVEGAGEIAFRQLVYP